MLKVKAFVNMKLEILMEVRQRKCAMGNSCGWTRSFLGRKLNGTILN